MLVAPCDAPGVFLALGLSVAGLADNSRRQGAEEQTCILLFHLEAVEPPRPSYQLQGLSSTVRGACRLMPTKDTCQGLAGIAHDGGLPDAVRYIRAGDS